MTTVATTLSHPLAEVPSVGGSGVGTPLRVHQSPTAGNPPTALDSLQRAASFLRRQSLMGETTPDASPKGRRYANKSAKPPNALAPPRPRCLSSAVR
ncbi:MAG: hypothetical protein PUQ00_30995 [Nostoc sp. S13]|nr:hypothetical protein [Nostoc sp. S13]